NDSSNKIQYPGQKEPNELGIYDMSGNIYEWTHSSSATEDTVRKILKGGSYVTLETDINNRTVSLETNVSNSPTYGNLGFRIVRTK
ncbi:MAG: SUMF1/EgtB/PvdO family nonheme iron enzyme, partial [Candidatus Sericytochromatia bacterium]